MPGPLITLFILVYINGQSKANGPHALPALDYVNHIQERHVHTNISDAQYGHSNMQYTHALNHKVVHTGFTANTPTQCRTDSNAHKYAHREMPTHPLTSFSNVLPFAFRSHGLFFFFSNGRRYHEPHSILRTFVLCCGDESKLHWLFWQLIVCAG